MYCHLRRHPWAHLRNGDNSTLLMASLCCSALVHSLPLCGKKFAPHKSPGTSSPAQLQPRTLSKSLEVHFHIPFRVFWRGLCWNYFQACSVCLPMEKEQVSSAPTQIASPQPASTAWTTAQQSLIRPSASNLISAVTGVHLSGRCLRLQWDSLSPFVACDWDSQPLSVSYSLAFAFPCISWGVPLYFQWLSGFLICFVLFFPLLPPGHQGWNPTLSIFCCTSCYIYSIIPSLKVTQGRAALNTPHNPLTGDIKVKKYREPRWQRGSAWGHP